MLTPDSSPKKKQKSTVVVTCEDSFSGQIPLAEKKAGAIVDCTVGTPFIAFASGGSVGRTHELPDQRSREAKKTQVRYQRKAARSLLANAGGNYFIRFVSLQPRGRWEAAYLLLRSRVTLEPEGAGDVAPRL